MDHGTQRGEVVGTIDSVLPGLWARGLQKRRDSTAKSGRGELGLWRWQTRIHSNCALELGNGPTLLRCGCLPRLSRVDG